MPYDLYYGRPYSQKGIDESQLHWELTLHLTYLDIAFSVSHLTLTYTIDLKHCLGGVLYVYIFMCRKHRAKHGKKCLSFVCFSDATKFTI